MKKILLSAALIFFSFCANANDHFNIDSAKSKIEFKAMQNDSAITGSFSRFSGSVDFDPIMLRNNKIQLEIDISSINTSLADATSLLKTKEWLALADFPKAYFVADKFTKISENKYSALGNLTIKNKVAPAKIEFVLHEYSTSRAKATGTAVIKRSSFEIGEADPANAHGVKDDIYINFAVEAVR